mgnify:CR=1 FL=1
MNAIGKIDAVYREKTLPVEAVTLYGNISRSSVQTVSGENPFANTRSMGLWQYPTADYVGQVNGEPPTEYTKDESGMITEVTRTLNLFA